MSYKLFAASALACLLPFAGLVHAQDSGPYKVLKIQLVGGEGGFDYVTADPQFTAMLHWSYEARTILWRRKEIRPNQVQVEATVAEKHAQH